MTKNQIEYWRNKETERHNKALEEQGLQDLEIRRQSNAIQSSANAETARYNRAREGLDIAKNQTELLKLSETNRSNLANEELRGKELAETNRHNTQLEFIQSNNNPWTTFATTIGSLFSDSPDGTSTGKGVATVVEDIWDRGVKPAASNVGGIIDSFKGTVLKQSKPIGQLSNGALNNGVKQLPNIGNYAKTSTSSKTQTSVKTTVNNNNPVKTSGRTLTLKGAKSR